MPNVVLVAGLVLVVLVAFHVARTTYIRRQETRKRQGERSAAMSQNRSRKGGPRAGE